MNPKELTDAEYLLWAWFKTTNNVNVESIGVDPQRVWDAINNYMKAEQLNT